MITKLNEYLSHIKENTSNFYNKNASKVFSVSLEDDDYDEDYEDLIRNIQAELKQIDYEKVGPRDPEQRHIDDDRSYPSRVIATKIVYNDNGNDSVRIYAIVRSGYYEGCNLDWEIETDEQDLEYGDTWFDTESDILTTELEKVYAENSTPLKVHATFSNGETIYKKANEATPITSKNKSGSVTESVSEEKYPHQVFKILEGLFTAAKSEFDKSRVPFELAMDLAGPSNKDLRQKIVEAYTGTKTPKAQCGVTRIEGFFKEWLEKYYDFKTNFH